MTIAERPSPPWLGGLSLVLLSVGVVILLTYTLLDVGWQQRLGGWNYLVSTVVMIGGLLPLRWWHSDPRTAG